MKIKVQQQQQISINSCIFILEKFKNMKIIKITELNGLTVEKKVFSSKYTRPCEKQLKKLNKFNKETGVSYLIKD